MGKIRRTQAEIKAGFPVEAKKSGITLKDWKAQQREIKEETDKRKKLVKPETPTRLRRTQEEIKAGLTVGEKKRGVTIADKKRTSMGEKVVETKLVSKTPYEDEVVDKIETSNDGTVQTVFKSRQTVIEKIIEKPVIKEVRILHEKDGRERTVKDIMEEEIGKCKYEWKRLPMDKSFKVTMLDTLGKQGWRFAFITNWKIMNPNTKKPDEVCFQKIII